MSVPPPPPPPQLKFTRPPPKQVSESSGPAFLADIKAGKALRKVPDSEKRDRSAPLASKCTDRNDAGSGSGTVSSISGGVCPPPMGLPNPFANGAPKLRPVGSVDVSRNNTVQNSVTRQPVGGYAKNPAPPPPPPTAPPLPQSSPPPSPPPASFVFPNTISSDIPSTTPYTVYQQRPNPVSNGISRVGSTNTDMNGIPVGQSTKVIRISSSGNSLNGNGNYNGEAISSTTTTPLLPSCVYDLNVPPPPPPPPPTTTTTTMMNSRAHPTPPPPPSIGNDYLNSNGGNNTNNNIASLVRQFEARFTFLDIGNIPVPKAYHGPKTYRSTASINHNINNNDGHRTQVPHRVAPSAPRNY
uniref:WH2 domain-containing protein n=1 Tax=Trichobilharzia regenti TaxID=157069 RepID=A0AA85IZM5_TRIRE|nr:unnamed protein product [Trichobilharzia regenti]